MNLRTVLTAAIAATIPLPALAVCIDGKTVSWYDEPGMLPKHPAPVGCASRDYKKGTQLVVTDLDTLVAVLCTVDDWGPMKWTGCDVDAGPSAATILDMRERGTIRASIQVAGYPWALEDRWPVRSAGAERRLASGTAMAQARPKTQPRVTRKDKGRRK